MAAPNVALCFGTFPPERNGGSDFVANFAEALVEAGAHVTVITSPASRSGPSGVSRDVGVERVIADWSFGRPGWRSLRRANAVLAEVDADILHVFFPDSEVQAGYQLPPLLGAPRLPLVTTFWSLGLGRRSPMTLRMTALGLLVRSRVVTSHDPSYLSTLRATVGRVRPVRWLPVGDNLQPPGEGQKRTPDRPRVDAAESWLGYFGQIDPTRGVEDLFAAVAILRRRRDVRVRMVGSAGRSSRYDADPAAASYFRSIKALPAALGIESAVDWTPYLPDAEAAAALAAVDVCVLPYRRNSVGRSALATALSLGRPTVLAGSPAEIAPLEPGVHVASVPRRKPEELAYAIERLLDDPAERAGLGARGERAAQLFAWPRIAATALELYREALGA